MEKYIKTTGKLYKNRMYACMNCGEIFEINNDDSCLTCPKCSSSMVENIQRTLSTIKEEKEVRHG